MDYDLPIEVLREDREAQKLVARDILAVLEAQGKCRYVYHRFFVVLFDDETFFDSQAGE